MKSEKKWLRGEAVLGDTGELVGILVPSVHQFVRCFINNPDVTKPHVVFTDAFYIDVLPASRWMFNLFLQDLVKAGGHDARWCHPHEQFCGGGGNSYFLYLEGRVLEARWKSHKHPIPQGSRLKPAMGLDWFDAWAFARWRSARLPTEAEWEKASRGPDGQLFPWGNELLDAEVPLRVHPTSGRWRYSNDPKYESPYGCRHVVTGPWEWCDDWFLVDGYDRLATTNPNAGNFPIHAIPPRDEWHERCRVVRGGLDLEGFYYPCADRWGHMPVYAHSDFGVRCVLSVPPEVDCDG